MKTNSFALYAAAIAFGLWGLIGHSAAWAAAALSFFAATMLMVGPSKKGTGNKTDPH